MLDEIDDVDDEGYVPTYLTQDRVDTWSLSHLGYLYPGTTPVMIKLDHNRSCSWV